MYKKLVLVALFSQLNVIQGAHLSSTSQMQKSIRQLNQNNQLKFNKLHPTDENFLQIDNKIKVDGLAKLLDDLSDDMTSVEIDDGSEDASAKKVVPKAVAEPDNSQFDNDVANGLGISVDAEEKVPADVQQIELPDESEEGDLNLPESSALVSEKSEEDNSSIMVDKEQTAATEEKKTSEDDIPSDGGASDITDADLATPAESKPSAPAAPAPVSAPVAETVPDASSEIQTESSSTSSTPNDAGLQETQDEVAATKKKFALLQAQMEANIQEVDNTRAQQADAFEHQNSDDPADQLKGLMSAQSSLKRMTSKFGAQSVTDKLSNFGQKLGIEVPAEIAQLGNNETISAALVELAVGMGKSEDEIAAALG